MIFSSDSFGRLNREDLINAEQSGLSVQGFRFSKYVEVNPSRSPRHKVGKCEIETVTKFAIV